MARSASEMTASEGGNPPARFILSVIDASFGRNAEEARERGEAERARKAIGIRSFPFFSGPLTRVILIIGRRVGEGRKGEEEAITYRHGSGMTMASQLAPPVNS